MGLDVRISLIVGVPLSHLGDITKTKEKIELLNPLGEPTGIPAFLEKVYLTSLCGDELLIGSNKEALASSNFYNNDIVYSYDDINEDYLYRSTYYPPPDQCIIGVHVKQEKGGRLGRFEAFSRSEIYDVKYGIALARDYLYDEFGYDGPVYVIAMPFYSY